MTPSQTQMRKTPTMTCTRTRKKRKGMKKKTMKTVLLQANEDHSGNMLQKSDEE
jgi:hypothetical protein